MWREERLKFPLRPHRLSTQVWDELYNSINVYKTAIKSYIEGSEKIRLLAWDHVLPFGRWKRTFVALPKHLPKEVTKLHGHQNRTTKTQFTWLERINHRMTILVKKMTRLTHLELIIELIRNLLTSLITGQVYRLRKQRVF